MESQLSPPPPALDLSPCDEFLIFEFKVRLCSRARTHDWTDCPFAHPGEKARRRDLRKFHYSASPCPDFRKGHCKRADACELSHGVFECWLHPARYRTQPCKDGTTCKRRVCFFAHSPEQLRTLLAGQPSSLVGHGVHSSLCSRVSSPTSTLIGHSQSPASLSPPLSPSMSPPGSPVDWSSPRLPKSSCCFAAPIPPSPSSPLALNCNLSQLHASFGQFVHLPQRPAPVPTHRRHLDRLSSSPRLSIPADDGGSYSSLSFPTSPSSQNSLLDQVELTAPESYWIQTQAVKAATMLPRLSTCPLSLIRTPVNAGWKSLDADSSYVNEKKVEPVALDRIESGTDLLAKVFESLTIGNQQNRNGDPDVSWVSELVR